VNYELSIFNRWGEIIFLSTDPNAPWDGTYKGQLVENGIYYYYIVYRKVVFNSMQGEVGKGFISVQR
jgi:gliding motility-associated-like protein